MVRLAKAVGAFLMGLALFLCVPGGAMKAAEPVKGGTLNVGFFDDTKTLDPVYSVALSERQILFLMFDNLIDVGPDFSLKSSLATSWEYQNGENRILLHLRTDVKFHDGTDFDADAVKWNLDWRMLPATNSPARSQLASAIDNVEVVDKATVAINLKQPFPPLLSLLTDRAGLMASPAAVKKWLDEDYPNIAARAKAEGAEVHWGDESGLRSDDVRGRGYAPKGETPVIRVNNKRHSLSVISSVTNKGQMRWKIFDGALNANILIDFLRRLIKGATKKVFLILDNLRVHHAKPVKAWLADHTDAIEVLYLPSYSPELNPDEMANADIKQGVTTRAPARTKLHLVKATARHLRSVQRQPERVRKYFEHEPVRYAA